jgi:hypothetical protein
MFLRLLIAVLIVVGLTFIAMCIVWLPKINKDDLWSYSFTREERVRETWKTIGTATLLSLLYALAGVILVVFFG